jgi:hypothetical protein
MPLQEARAYLSTVCGGTIDRGIERLVSLPMVMARFRRWRTGRECDLCESGLGSTRDRPEDEVPTPAEKAADAFPRLKQLLGRAYVATAAELIRIGVLIRRDWTTPRRRGLRVWAGRLQSARQAVAPRWGNASD